MLKETLDLNCDTATDKLQSEIYHMSSGKINTEWLLYIWKYIIENNIVNECIHLHLIPIDMNPNALLFSPQWHCIQLQKSGVNISIVKAMESLGITVFSQSSVTSLIDSSGFIDFKITTPGDVVEILHSIAQDSHSIDKIAVHFNAECADTDKINFRHFLGSSDICDLKDSHFILEKLELFLECSSVNTEFKGDLVPVTKNNKIINFKSFPVELPDKFLISDGQSTCDLAKLLGCISFDVERVVHMALKCISNYDQESRCKFMDFFLSRIDDFGTNENISLASNVNFLTCEEGHLHTACELFQPQLQHLFFLTPCKVLNLKYEHSPHLPTFKKLKIKTHEHITDIDIIEVCTSLHQIIKQEYSTTRPGNQFTTSEQLLRLANSVLEHIENNFQQCSISGSVLDAIGEKQIIPHKSKPPDSFPSTLPWFGGTRGALLSRPVDVLDIQNQNVVGSVACVLNCEQFPELSKYYGWNVLVPTRSQLEDQIRIIKHNFCPNEKDKFRSILHDVYEQLFMNHKVEDSKVAFEEDELLFAGNNFVSPSKVLLPSEDKGQIIELWPYMTLLIDQDSLLQWPDKLTRLGCKTCLTTDMAETILKEIQIHHLAQQMNPHRIKRDIKIAVDILTFIADSKTDIDDIDSLGDILIPTLNKSDCISFSPIKDTTYRSDQWLNSDSEEDEIDDDDDVIFVHHDITSNLAKKLGVKYFINRFLEGNDTSELTGDIGESFGQHEPLTTRLKCILDGYQDGIAVFKVMEIYIFIHTED